MSLRPKWNLEYYSFKPNLKAKEFSIELCPRALRGAEKGAGAAGRAEGGRHELRLCRRVQPRQVQRSGQGLGTLIQRCRDIHVGVVKFPNSVLE